MIRTAICETDMRAEMLAAAVHAARIALEILDADDFHPQCSEILSAGVRERMVLLGRSRGNRIWASLDDEELQVEVTNRHRAPPLQMAFLGPDPWLGSIRLSNFPLHVGQSLRIWLEALEHPTGIVAPSARETSVLRAERIVAAAAHAFGIDFHTAWVEPPQLGHGVRIQFQSDGRTVEFAERVPEDVGPTINAELARALLLDHEWARWTVTANECDPRLKLTFVEFERIPLVVRSQHWTGGPAILRLVADHLPTGGRLLWNGSECAPPFLRS